MEDHYRIYFVNQIKIVKVTFFTYDYVESQFLCPDKFDSEGAAKQYLRTTSFDESVQPYVTLFLKKSWRQKFVAMFTT